MPLLGGLAPPSPARLTRLAYPLTPGSLSCPCPAASVLGCLSSVLATRSALLIAIWLPAVCQSLRRLPARPRSSFRRRLVGRIQPLLRRPALGASRWPCRLKSTFHETPYCFGGCVVEMVIRHQCHRLLIRRSLLAFAVRTPNEHASAGARTALR